MTLHTYPDVEQDSEQWHDLRRGIVTASVVGKLVTSETPAPLTVACSKCGSRSGVPCMSQARKEPTPIKVPHPERASRAAELPPMLVVADNDTSRGLATTLAAERITGWTEDTPMTSDMWRGRDSEPFAREHYSQHHAPAEQHGFMVRDDWGFSIGYSPDGLVGDDGCIEIKSPRAKNHIATVLADEVPAHYMAQCQAALLVSGRAWCDYISYVGGLPLFVKRVYPDPDWHAVILAAVADLETEAAALVAEYTKRTDGLPVTERIDFDIQIG